jgi:tetratricopeptide (TPR) repeat protein
MARVAVRHSLVGAILALLSMQVMGQDLGSSNKLFVTPKKRSPSAAKPARRTPVRSRTTAAKKKRATPVRPAPTTAKKKQEVPVAAGPVTAETKPAATPEPDPITRTPVISAPEKVKTEVTSGLPKKAQKTEKLDPATNERFEHLVEMGNVERGRRNYLAAESAYRRANLIKPGDPRSVYALGDLYSDQLRWEDAEDGYRAALELQPDAAAVHVALSYILTQPIAAPNLSGRYLEAEDLARKAIKLAPDDPLSFDQLGVALEMLGRTDAESENAYRTAISLDPLFAPAHAHLGRLLRRRGLIRESQESYANAVRLSNDVGTMIVVANVLQSEGRFAESEELLQKAMIRDPRNPTALLLLGRSLTALGRYDEAEEALRLCLSVINNNYMANNLLATLYLRQEKPDQAGDALSQALKFVSLHEKRSLARQFEAVGDAYIKSARPRQAEHAYRQAIALDPDCQLLSSKVSAVM